jgi:hypothetical protein
VGEREGGVFVRSDSPNGKIRTRNIRMYFYKIVLVDSRSLDNTLSPKKTDKKYDAEAFF